MSEAKPNVKDNVEGSLLWDCFVNWATTLEKLEKPLDQRSLSFISMQGKK